MSFDLQLLRKYYQGWKSGFFDQELFLEDFSFRTPLDKAENVPEFLDIVKQMSQWMQIDSVEFKALFADGYGNGCAVYDFLVKSKHPIRVECADLFQIQDNKIKEVHLICDARELEKFKFS